MLEGAFPGCEAHNRLWSFPQRDGKAYSYRSRKADEFQQMPANPVACSLPFHWWESSTAVRRDANHFW